MNKKYLIATVAVYVILMSSLVSAGFYYNVKLNYDNGDIKIKSVNVEFSHYEMYNPYNEDNNVYSAKIGTGKETLFSVSGKQYYDSSDNSTGEINGGGVIEVNKTELELFIPYEEARELVIYNSSGYKMDSYSLIQFTKEYSKEEYNEINSKRGEVPEEDLGEEYVSNITNEYKTREDTTEIKNYDTYYIVAIIILVIILVIIIYLSISKNPKKENKTRINKVRRQ